MRLKSYIAGKWQEGQSQGEREGVELCDAVSGKPLCFVSSDGLDFQSAVLHAKNLGGPALRKLTFHERAAALKSLAKHLLANKEKLYELSARTGATRADSWVDIEGGIGTLFSYASMVARELPNDVVMVEGDMERLSAKGSFVGRHILCSKPGVAVHINAFNFPCWGMLEKMAPSLAAGMPVIIKPATPSAFLAEALMREIIASEIFPEGSIQLICGSAGDLLDHRLDLRLDRDVAGDSQRRTAPRLDLLGGLPGPLLDQVHDGHLGARRRKSPRHPPAEAATRAGDDHGLILVVVRCHVPALLP